MTARSRHIELATGLRYHILEWGGDEPELDHTVVLIHGFLDLAWGWERTVRSGLEGKFHIVAPDMRGHGDSDRVGAGGYYHFLDYIADLHSLVSQLRRQRLSLVGHSMGGSIASYYAGAFPDALHRLALLEGLGPPEQSEAVPDLVKRWATSWPNALAHSKRVYDDVSAAAAQLRRHDPLLSEELALELATRGTTPVPGEGVRFKHDPLHLTRGPYPYQVATARQFWQRVQCPVLLVDGDQSRFRLAATDYAGRADCFAKKEEHTLRGAAHMMQRHQPQALARLLSEFLQADATRE